ncbi:MAG: hypothetical protein SYNGOMJ08_00154 [Candidatus Syntrophoarchaeum sp. GoM_oil]|nr:MAG: hypothetical protein SYNGOMJ08_00154 [Candidatus Syntrophoarchaeum sp. GoM_oil]
MMRNLLKKGMNLIFFVLLIGAVVTAVSMTSVMGDRPLSPNKFYGDVTLNGTNAPVGTVINAYIDNELRGSVTVATAGKYGDDFDYLKVDGHEADDGKTIIFYVNGVRANETAAWHVMVSPMELDLGAAGEPEPTPTATEPGGMLTDAGRDWLATYAGIGGCFVDAGVPYVDADGISGMGSSVVAVTVLITANMVGKPDVPILQGKSYNDFKAVNGGDMNIGADLDWVIENTPPTGSFCASGAEPTPTPTATESGGTDPTVTATPTSSPTPSPTATETVGGTPTVIPTTISTVTPTITSTPATQIVKEAQLNLGYKIEKYGTGTALISLTIQNVGEVKATDINLKIDHPVDLQVKAVSGCKLDATFNRIYWSGEELQPDEEHTCNYTITLTEPRDIKIEANLTYDKGVQVYTVGEGGKLTPKIAAPGDIYNMIGTNVIIQVDGNLFEMSGFTIPLAIAGLLAVAYLVRRKK